MQNKVCKKCKKRAVIKTPRYCKDHFVEYFENKVKKTIKDFKLLNKSQKIVVAASGGKDSLTVLHILNKFGYDVTALAINEGIANYRDNTLSLLREYCEKYNIKIKIVSFKEEFKKTLDQIIVDKKTRPCTVCGVFRRYLLNKYSSGFDVLATGHNLDDEAQAVLMNLTKNNIGALRRQGPVSGINNIDKFTKRVKPLYFCSEKEIMFYANINKLVIDFSCCPNIQNSFRLRLKKTLNEIEQSIPDAKKNIVKWYIDYKSNVSPEKEGIERCSKCGQPCTGKLCNACKFKEKISA